MEDHQKQPYDATLKALLRKQMAEMLPYILPNAQFLGELNSEVLKIQPPLRADKVCKVTLEGEVHIVHFEIETRGKKIWHSACWHITVCCMRRTIYL